LYLRDEFAILIPNLDKHQIPNTNNQIITNIPMTEISVLVVLEFGNWRLFGIWLLEFGISKSVSI
jgi:hypothetical protein